MSSTFGIYMIVRNEEQYIKRALSSFLQCADEIIVVDTGCIDNTMKEIASLDDERIKTYQTDWPYNFSKARNFAMSLTTSEFILSMDADEYFDDNLIETIKQLKENNFNGYNYFKLNLENFSNNISNGIRHGERVLVSRDIKPNYRYCVHEKIYCEKPLKAYDMKLSEGRIIHTHDNNVHDNFDTYRQLYYNDLNSNLETVKKTSHYYYYLFYTMKSVDHVLAYKALSKCYSYEANGCDHDYRFELRNNVVSESDFTTLIFTNISNPNKNDYDVIGNLYFNSVKYMDGISYQIISEYIWNNLNKQWDSNVLELMFNSYCLKTYQNMMTNKYIKITDEFIRRFPNNGNAQNNIAWNKTFLIPRLDKTLFVITENQYTPSLLYYAKQTFKNIVILNEDYSYEFNIGDDNIKRFYSTDEIDKWVSRNKFELIVKVNPQTPCYLKEFSNIFNYWLTTDDFYDDIFAFTIKMID